MTLETIYFQSENGTMSKELWEAEKRVLKFVFAMPGVQQWRALPLLPFSDAFRAEVDELQA